MGAAIARSRHDPRELTRNGRAAFLARFEAQVLAEQPDLPPAEVQRRAGELRRAYFLNLAAKSSVARAKKKGVDPDQRVDARKVRDATSTRPPQS